MHFKGKFCTREEINKLYPNFTIVAEHFAGESFGEYALLKNIKRTATIIAKEDTKLITLNK